MNKYLIIDSNNLCFRALHTTGFSDLSTREKETGIIFGFLRQIYKLSKDFKTSNFIFCWDSKKSLRELVYPEYKQKRKSDLTEEQRKERIIAYRQFTELRVEVLPKLGFKNIFMKSGFEADDLMANIVFKYNDVKYSKEFEFVICSTDQDLYQLLSSNVIMFNWKKTYDIKDLMEEYKIGPGLWASAKAIAGCSTDNVEGVKGVGEKTAIKYIVGKLNTDKKAYKDIKNSEDIIERNRSLVMLPYKRFNLDIVPDDLTQVKFIDVFTDYDFRSFLERSTLDKWFERFNIECPF